MYKERVADLLDALHGVPIIRMIILRREFHYSFFNEGRAVCTDLTTCPPVLFDATSSRMLKRRRHRPEVLWVWLYVHF